MIDLGDPPFPPTQKWLSNCFLNVRRLRRSDVLDFPNTLAQTSSDRTMTVAGAVVGDCVQVVPALGSMFANTIYDAFVSAQDEVTVRFHNYSAVAKNPPSGVFRVLVTPQ